MNVNARLAQSLSHLPLKRKFLIQTALVALGTIALAVIAARMQYLDLTGTRQEGLKAQTEMALGVIEGYADQVKRGALDEDEAKARALATLSTMQANKGVDYFFVTDEVPTMLMHPTRPDLIGKPLDDVLSPDGKRIFPEFVRVAQAGGGHVNYSWAKAGEEDPVPKTSYAVLYQPWGWVIGTGVYVDDTQAQALQFTFIMTVAGGLLVLLSMAIGWVIGQSVLEPVSRALAAIKGVSRGDLSVRTGHHGRDEVGQMLKATDEMVHMLERFSHETRDMIRLHAAEDISHRMPEDFPGVYGELAGGINTMMFEHLDAFRDAVGILERYASGDLSQDARRLPGTRAFLHEAMDAAKTSLLAINSEIRRLAAAAAAGDFSVRGDEAGFRHDFLHMVQGLNAMMATSDRNLAELSHDVRREVGVLIDRRGRVISVSVADAKGTEFPDLRMGENRLSGFHLLHTHPRGGALSKGDLSTLFLRRLDAVSAVEVAAAAPARPARRPGGRAAPATPRGAGPDRRTRGRPTDPRRRGPG